MLLIRRESDVTGGIIKFDIKYLPASSYRQVLHKPFLFSCAAKYKKEQQSNPTVPGQSLVDMRS
jgi:hypothetical protein